MEDKMNFRTFEQDGLIFDVYRMADDDITPDVADNPARYDDWIRGNWRYVVVCVDVRLKTTTTWAVLPIVVRASLGGIESDSGRDYFASIEANLIDDARADVEVLRKALEQVPVRA